MAVYVIGYDLDRPGQNYAQLDAAIKAYGTWMHHLDSTWFISSSQSAEQIRNNLQRFIDSNDKLVVARLSGESAWYGLPDEAAKWLKQQLDGVVV